MSSKYARDSEKAIPQSQTKMSYLKPLSICTDKRYEIDTSLFKGLYLNKEPTLMVDQRTRNHLTDDEAINMLSVILEPDDRIINEQRDDNIQHDDWILRNDDWVQPLLDRLLKQKPMITKLSPLPHGRID